MLPEMMPGTTKLMVKRSQSKEWHPKATPEPAKLKAERTENGQVKLLRRCLEEVEDILRQKYGEDNCKIKFAS
nr:hypothetical protein HmN_000674100 [Hymenolepis microstoma]